MLAVQFVGQDWNHLYYSVYQNSPIPLKSVAIPKIDSEIDDPAILTKVRICLCDF